MKTAGEISVSKIRNLRYPSGSLLPAPKRLQA